MNYSGLRAIITSIKSSVICPSCEGAFGDDDLAVVSAIDERCVVVAQCASCHSAILVTAALQAPGAVRQPQAKNSFLVQQTEDGEVSRDDVVSIHELLKDYSGDITALVDDQGKA